MAKLNTWNLNAVKLVVAATLLCVGSDWSHAASVAGQPRVAERKSTLSMKALAAMQQNPAWTNLISKGQRTVPGRLLPSGISPGGGGGEGMIAAASGGIISAASAGTTSRTSPPPAVSFQALPDDITVIPPDTHGAVGPNHVMTTLNSQVRIQDRSGNVLSTVSLEFFWLSLGVTDVFDPKVFYDHSAGRWIFVAMTERLSPRSGVLLAVSQTSDPTGNWFRYLLDGDATDTLWADYPSVGFNKDWIVISANMFPITALDGRVHLFVVDKAEKCVKSCQTKRLK